MQITKRKINKEYLELKDTLKNKYGIYFLYSDKKELVYIGKSMNLYDRIQSSVLERSKSIKIKYIKYLITKSASDMHVIELYFINKYKPILNSDSLNEDSITFDLDVYYKSISELIKINIDRIKINIEPKNKTKKNIKDKINVEYNFPENAQSKFEYFFINKDLVKIIGVYPSYFITSILNYPNDFEFDKWFYISRNKIEEITGYKRRTIEVCVKKLIEFGILSIHNKSMPKITLYKINKNNIYEYIK